MTNGSVLITGGAGFIGTNLADRLVREGVRVLIADDLSRRGSADNLEWLTCTHGSKVKASVVDVRDPVALRDLVAQVDFVYHLAAQVAVTTSLQDPLADFDVNTRGTLNVLEAMRALPNPPGLLYTSTNKVYGALSDVGLHCLWNRYEPDDLTMARSGVDESRRLEFYSPYGCSKGAADQYVLDYARNFGVPAMVFRMSCIYGPHQNGTEDQGWLAHFVLCALHRDPITIYGDGKQVRDVLFVEDLVEAMLRARAGIGRLAGRAFNIGGGPANSLSLVELLQHIRQQTGETPLVKYSDWRPGDQRYYVSNTEAFRSATGWSPKVGVLEGTERLHQWLSESMTAGSRVRR